MVNSSEPSTNACNPIVTLYSSHNLGSASTSYSSDASWQQLLMLCLGNRTEDNRYEGRM